MVHIKKIFSFIYSLQHIYEVRVVTPIFQRMKLRVRKIHYFAQDHTVRK